MNFKLTKLIRSSRTKNESGATLVLVTVFMVALFAFSALSVDVGNVLVHRARIHEASDASALAAVTTWAQDKDVTLTQQVGTNYEGSHGVQPSEIVSITTGRWDDSAKTFVAATALTATDVPAVEIIAQRTVNLAFAPIIGMHNMSPRVRSVAIAAKATSAYGAVPWGVCNNSGLVPNVCSSVALQNDNSCGGSGNFGALSLGGNGADVYEDNIHYGYQGSLKVGEQYYTETGKMVGPTKAGVNDRINGAPAYDCSTYPVQPHPNRLIVVPVIKLVSEDKSTGKHLIEITDFWVFVLDDVTGGGDVTARFLETYSAPTVDPSAPPTPGGLNGVALVQ